MPDTPTTAGLPHAGLLRRLVAMFYDGLLLLSVLAIASALLMPVTGAGADTYNPLLTLYFLAVAYLFFGWFWTHGGQTLGMRAWRLRLVARDSGEPVGARLALLRFLAALLSWLPLGLGFLWSLFDRDRLAWHDRLSGTVLVLIPKSAYRS